MTWSVERLVRDATVLARAIAAPVLAPVFDYLYPPLTHDYDEVWNWLPDGADELAEHEAEEEVSEPTFDGCRVVVTDALPPHIRGITLDPNMFDTSSAAASPAGVSDAVEPAPVSDRSPAASCSQPQPAGEPQRVIPETVTRVVVCRTELGFRTEGYTEERSGRWTVSVQDDGRTLKLFPEIAYAAPIETGHDIGLSTASELFPQHQREAK